MHLTTTLLPAVRRLTTPQALTPKFSMLLTNDEVTFANKPHQSRQERHRQVTQQDQRRSPTCILTHHLEVTEDQE